MPMRRLGPNPTHPSRRSLVSVTVHHMDRVPAEQDGERAAGHDASLRRRDRNAGQQQGRWELHQQLCAAVGQDPSARDQLGWRQLDAAAAEYEAGHVLESAPAASASECVIGEDTLRQECFQSYGGELALVDHDAGGDSRREQGATR